MAICVQKLNEKYSRTHLIIHSGNHAHSGKGTRRPAVANNVIKSETRAGPPTTARFP